jgi:adenine-specific DNA-methyltransferase
MTKIQPHVGALDARIESLLTSLENERVDPKVLSDLVYDAVGLEFGEHSQNRFRAEWRGKKNILSTIQRPSRATLLPDRSASLNFPKARHVAIEGENLEVMKIIERAYFGRIKMIYMNPPFNIGGELIVADSANLFERYISYVTGSADSEKIGIAGGSGHSEWMNSVYARLFIARNLLSQDGVIFVSIDDHESHHLRTMMDEIFGSENFVASFVWEKRYSPPPDAQDVGYVHENIICYRRSEDFSAGLLPMTEDQSARYTNPDSDPRGPWKAADYTCRYTSDERPTLYYPVTNPNTGQEILPKKTRVWACSRTEHEKNVEEKRIWWGVAGDNSIPSKKKYLFEIKQGAMPKTILQHDVVGHTDEATKELRSHLPALKLSSKPTRLMQHILSIANVKSDDIVLDCYAGTGSMGEAIFNMERDGIMTPSFILIEFPEKLANQNTTLSEAMFSRLTSSASADGALSSGFRAFKLEASHFRSWEANTDENTDLVDLIDRHVDYIKDNNDSEGLFFEIICRAGFPLSTQYSVIEVEGKKLFSLEDGNYLICVDNQITIELVEAVAEMNPSQVIFLDEGFRDNDELKTNAAQTFKARSQAQDVEIAFRTI